MALYQNYIITERTNNIANRNKMCRKLKPKQCRNKK